MPRYFELMDAAASTATAYTLGVGDTIQGRLGTLSDRDFYRLFIAEGETYTVSLVGTGADNLTDTYLRILANDGVSVIGTNDDALKGFNSRITFTASYSGYVYVSAESFANSYTGQYDLNISNSSRPSFEPSTGAGMIDADESWSSTPGTGATVTWAARRTGTPNDAQGAPAPFSQFTGAQIAAVTQAMASIADVCGLTFQRLDDGDGFNDAASMLFGNYASTTDGAGAYAAYPLDGDVWANTVDVSTANLDFGSYSYFALMHEIGHAVGLSHPGRYNAAPGVSITYAVDAQFREDSQQFTMMSYFDESATGGEFSGYTNAPMLLDILALQNIYGANMTTRVGDTIYGFSGTAGATFNFSAGANAFCIWDAGGVDTLNGAGDALSQTIDLREGGFSSMAGLTRNVSIAYGAFIENAVGGSGADILYGNDRANVLDGGGAADAMLGFGGDDTFIVNHASDQVFEALGGGFDTVSVRASYTLAAGQEIERLIVGNAASNLNYSLTGNEFAQTIVGGAGANTINGGRGSDTLTGLGGADRFVFDSTLGASNVDTITDFSAVDDTIVLDRTIFTALSVGNLAGSAFANGAAATDSSDRIIYNSATGGLFYDADGNGAGASVRFATLATGLAINQLDFTVVA